MSNNLLIGEQIYRSRFKSPTDGVYNGEYDGQEVVVKRGGRAILREAEVLEQVDHESIPKVFDALEEDGKFLLVMSRLGGMPLPQKIGLDSRWNSEPQDISEVLRITRGAALGFTALRAAGYLYRDLNLGHLLVGSDVIGLCDHEADVSVDENGTGRVDSMTGTWETMAPEEFEVGNTISEASSTYTLGVLMLQLAKGENPFNIGFKEGMTGDQMRQLAYEAHSKGVTVKTGDAAIDWIIVRALAPEPSDRFQTLDSFIDALST